MHLALHYIAVCYYINYIIYSSQLIFWVEFLWFDFLHCSSCRCSWETWCCHWTENQIVQQIFCLTTLPFFIWAVYALSMQIFCKCGTLHDQCELCLQILGCWWAWRSRGWSSGKAQLVALSHRGLIVLNEPVRWKAKHSPTPSFSSPRPW